MRKGAVQVLRRRTRSRRFPGRMGRRRGNRLESNHSRRQRKGALRGLRRRIRSRRRKWRMSALPRRSGNRRESNHSRRQRKGAVRGLLRRIPERMGAPPRTASASSPSPSSRKSSRSSPPRKPPAHSSSPPRGASSGGPPRSTSTTNSGTPLPSSSTASGAAQTAQILSAHKGPARRFRAPVYHHRGNGRATADDWLKSPALRNLQELELCGFQLGLPLLFRDPRPSPVGAFRFSQTLVVATIGNCQFPDIAAQPIQFPKLKKLCLQQVTISESSLHAMIAGCLALECLLIELSNGFHCLRINSITIRNICLKSCPGELIIENAPCLERLLQLIRHDSHTSVIAAPKLDILGWLSSYYCTALMLGSTVIQGLRVDTQKSVLPTVKILSVDMGLLSLDTIINLMRCFPCLERLYIKCPRQGETNVWRGKHRLLLKSKSFDICLKRIYWRCYFGTKSHVSFATFFVENAKVLELMTFRVHPEENYNEVYIAQQSKVLKLDSKASRGAQFRFTPDDSHREARDFCLNDLDLADPFERKDPSRFIDLS